MILLSIFLGCEAPPPRPSLIPSCDTIQSWFEPDDELPTYVLCPETTREFVAVDEVCDHELIWIAADGGGARHYGCESLGRETHGILEPADECEVPSPPVGAEDVILPGQDGLAECTDIWDLKN